MRYRMQCSIAATSKVLRRSVRAKMDSKYAALYYPWVRVLDPVTRCEIVLRRADLWLASMRGTMCNAQCTSSQRTVVNGAIGFEILLNKGQQEVLNPKASTVFALRTRLSLMGRGPSAPIRNGSVNLPLLCVSRTLD